MADLDEAAGEAQEALELAVSMQQLNESLKGDLGAARQAVGDAPQSVAEVLTSLEATFVPRTLSIAETAGNAEGHLRSADQTERFPETTAALQRLDEAKSNVNQQSATLDECLSYARLAEQALRELSGRLITTEYQCDTTDVALLDAKNQIEDVISRLSS